ncbi:MAG: MBL fold metallo-hydrolase [Candidatus Tectomicrobia bacterium]|uniref:MBL fold metallo-hydrolase n=1 Tax=Tectimicrobiota bacterium TaxID=2528274 RepID=A0A933GLV0_UNCTE|nr:MBL fold metallo-hydrolase [Candidatus Tectomicrobia bacterium]
MKEIRKQIWVETEWQGANVSCIGTERGTVLVDIPTLPGNARTWKAKITEMGLPEVAYIINTDHHFDHLMGNCFFNGLIITHKLAAEEIAKPGGTLFEGFIDNWKENFPEEVEEAKRLCKLMTPHITFSKNMELNMGNRVLQVIHVGGHTPGTSMVYIQQEKVLFSGDTVVSNRHPFLGQGNLLEWRKALEEINKMDVETIVPGHGEVCTLNEACRLLNYFKEIESELKEQKKKGLSKEEAAKKVDIIGYFPVDPGMEATAAQWLNMGLERFYDQV